MGYYIETSRNHGKAEEIAAKFNGEVLAGQPRWEDIPVGKGIVVVLHNRGFEAAGFAFNKQEYGEFTRPTDRRFKEFVLLDYATAAKESGYGR